MSIYALKPKFQRLLRPLAAALARSGVTANQVTVLACALSVLAGILLVMFVERRALFVLLPLVLFVRLAMNALDGMLAREFGQKSDLGAFLNELSDVTSDAVLYLPFAFLPHFQALWVGIAIVLAVVSEMAGTVAVMTGASRRYDGPLGKSDRAFLFGALGLAVALGIEPAEWTSWVFPVVALLLCLTIGRRVRNALAELAQR